jgi:hypothetical protein
MLLLLLATDPADQGCVGKPRDSSGGFSSDPLSFITQHALERILSTAIY